MYNLLALSGSLREKSYNSAALEALRHLAEGQANIIIGSIRALPLFNPDYEAENNPCLTKLDQQLASADGIIIASPEYAHGISGPMKNALDWLVGSVEFPYKPIMLINTSPRAKHAIASLTEVLKTMSGIIVESAAVEIPLLGSNLGSKGILENEKISASLSRGLESFCKEIDLLKRHDDTCR